MDVQPRPLISSYDPLPSCVAPFILQGKPYLGRYNQSAGGAQFIRLEVSTDHLQADRVVFAGPVLTGCRS